MFVCELENHRQSQCEDFNPLKATYTPSPHPVARLFSYTFT